MLLTSFPEVIANRLPFDARLPQLMLPENTTAFSSYFLLYLYPSFLSRYFHDIYNFEYDTIRWFQSTGDTNFWDKTAHRRQSAAFFMHKQIVQYIQLLEDHGTRLGENITKHLDDGIWELRPGNNRVLYFFFTDDTFVLLHQFRKKTRKTPPREIEKAKAERADWISRKESTHGKLD